MVFRSALLILLVPIIDTLELDTVLTKCIAGGYVNKSVVDIIIEGVFQPEDLHVIRLVLLTGLHQIAVKGCKQLIDGPTALFQRTEVAHSLPLEFLVHIVEIKVLRESGKICWGR